MHLNRHDTGSTTARSVDEVALIRDTISHYAPVLIALLSTQIRRAGVQKKFGGALCNCLGHYKPLCACVDRTFVNPNSSRRRPEKFRSSRRNGGRDGERAVADPIDGVALRAMH